MKGGEARVCCDFTRLSKHREAAPTIYFNIKMMKNYARTLFHLLDCYIKITRGHMVLKSIRPLFSLIFFSSFLAHPQTYEFFFRSWHRKIYASSSRQGFVYKRRHLFPHLVMVAQTFRNSPLLPIRATSSRDFPFELFD